jgi:hypothetical protein
MKSLALVGVLGLLGTGCYQQYGPGPAAPMGQIQPEPVAVSGPPGGEVDPGYSYEQPTGQDPSMPGYPSGYPEGYPAGTESGAPADPYAQPAATDGINAMGTVTDAEIDSTLAPYGEWITHEEYGRVWRPHATVVGASFTPYETCGSWVWTDYGWTYQCDWDWGWLPFHYGQWDWFDGGWGWVPDYTWGPGWVDWRYGGGYVGWRPQRPIVRDHRGQGYNASPRFPRPQRDSDWRFQRAESLGRRIRGNLSSLPEAIAVTKQVAKPPIRGNYTVSAAAVMSRRFPERARTNPYGDARRPYERPNRPAYRGQQSFDRNPPRTFDNRAYPRGVQQPRYPQPSRGAYQPSRGYDNRGTYQQPSRGTYQPSRGYDNRGTYQQPSRGTYQPSRGSTYQPPRGTYQQPSRGTYQPSRGNTYQPSRTYSPPSSPSRTYSPPSRPSSSGSSYSRPSSSSGSSYSRPSSSSGSSRSSGSSSSGSSRGSSSGSSSGGSRGRR